MSFYWMKNRLFKSTIISYVVWTVFLFALIYFEGISPFYAINKIHTTLNIFLTSQWINFFDIPVKLISNKIHFSHGMNLMILDECNGLVPILLYSGSILSYPTIYKKKIIWFFIGYTLLLLFNSIRIDFIIFATTFSPQYFHFIHDYVGRYFISFLTLIIFMLFVRDSRISSN